MIFMSAVMPNILQIQAWVQDHEAPEGSLPALSISESWQPTRQIKGFFEIDQNDIIERIEKPPLTEYWFGGHLNYVSDRGDLAQPLQIRRLIETKETFRRSINRKTKEAYSKRESQSSFGIEENAAEIAKRYVNANLDPVLVFFISRDETRSFCKYLASSENYSPVDLAQREQTQYDLFLNYLKERLGDKHPLAEFASKGIAYHHGWLPRDVRAEIEYAFSRRWIRVIASTTTLIEGVNFPISTFILANYEQVIGSQNNRLITWRLEKKDFQNMIGRAGRAVYDTEGQIIFMIPSRPITSHVTWQDYLFASPNDPERMILSSLNREDFRRSILEQILNAMEDPNMGTSALSIDPDALKTHYGPGAKEVGDTVLRLQAFLLALTDREVLDPENLQTIFKFFRLTLFGQQQPDDTLRQLVARFTQKTGQLMNQAESDKQRRAIYGKIGLGFTSCQALYQKARDFWLDYGQKMFDKEVEHITSDFLTDISDFAFSFPEVRPESIKIPHTRPTEYLVVPHGDVISKWVVSLSSLSAIRDDYFKEITELAERSETCTNYIRDAFEYKAPWILILQRNVAIDRIR
jgi:helicase